MLFIGRDEEHIPGLHRLPGAIAVNFPCPGINEHFMLPIVGMFGRVASRGNLKDPHTKIRGAVTLADNHPGRDAFGGLAVEMSCLGLGIRGDFHHILLGYLKPWLG